MERGAVARGRGHWLFVATLLAGLAGIVVLRVFATPDPRGHGTHEQFGLPPCMMMKYAGVPCPGCGVTTAISCMAHGDVLAAIAIQPFGALVALLIVVASALAFVDTVRGKDAWVEFRRRTRPWVYWGVGVAMLASWGYKIIALRA